MIAVPLLLGVTATGCASTAAATSRTFVPATDERLTFSDRLQVVADPADESVHFDRGIDVPGRGLRWDAPGARLRWRTDSRQVRVRLRYASRHTGGARNGVGAFQIDGQRNPGWTFDRTTIQAADGWLELPVPGDGAHHLYELILPYGEAVDLLGVEVSGDAHWQPPAPRPATRYLAFGDSVTHGFDASEVTQTYPFLVGERLYWEVMNLGIAGLGTQGMHGAVLGGIDADVVSLLIGVNDWQGGADLESFRRQYTELLTGVRQARPNRPLVVITPLWVAPFWQPEKARYPLEAYRQVIRDVVAAQANAHLRLVEGPSLIDPDPALFNRIAVHPNDAGFAQLAERLAVELRAALEMKE